jgi:hypothetical protein
MVFYPEDEATEEVGHCEIVTLLFLVFTEFNNVPLQRDKAKSTLHRIRIQVSTMQCYSLRFVRSLFASARILS